jgi:hypothetical protein
MLGSDANTSTARKPILPHRSEPPPVQPQKVEAKTKDKSLSNEEWNELMNRILAAK